MCALKYSEILLRVPISRCLVQCLFSFHGTLQLQKQGEGGEGPGHACHTGQCRKGEKNSLTTSLGNMSLTFPLYANHNHHNREQKCI